MHHLVSVHLLLKKCICNCQKAGDADAQFDKSRTEQTAGRKKSASATAKKQETRMQDQANSGQIEKHGS